MGVTLRKYQHRIDLLSKSLKRPLKLTADTMTFGFTDKQFYDRFKELFPDRWKEICETAIDNKRHNDHRVLERHKRPVPAIGDAQKFIERRCKAIITNRRKQLSQDASTEKEEKLYKESIVKAKNKIAVEKKKTKEKFAIQKVTPNDVKKLINEYYQLRKHNPVNIDELNNIIKELGKYECDDTIITLEKIQNCDKHVKLRESARKALIEMHTHKIWLERQYKGEKAKDFYNKEPHEMRTPEELYEYLTTKTWQRDVDVFVSHFSKDRELIITLKDMLNNQGLDCYVDWMYDREQLSRELTCKETAAVLIKRMEQSKALLYVLTEEALESQWMPWELGFFSALNKPIYVYKPTEIKYIPKYIELYKQVWLENNKIGYKEGDCFIPLKREQ